MKIVLQYNILYCDSRGSRLLDCVATQGRDTASQATTRRRRARAARRRWAQAGEGGYVGGRRGHAGGARWARRLGARGVGSRPVRTWACCWVVGCALGALSLFLTRFDSVLFLSQFLDTVHEPGS